MSGLETRHKLAAVLAADAVGYTRLMQADADATVAALDAARQLFRDAAAREDGQVVDTAGDSVLAVFATASGAVRAALAVQQALTDAPRMRFRIGIHMGELIEKTDGTVYGDGVNVAARLQALAAPGGICLSAVVADAVAGRIDARFEDVGSYTLKNVARAVQVYAWGGVAAAAGRRVKPTVCVADFDARGGEGAAALAADVREGIMTALANQTGIVVVADAAAADYVVSVTLQTAGTRYRANLRILDQANAEQFGADRFEGTFDDPFTAADDLAYRLYNAVRFALHGRETALVQRARVDADMDSHTLMLRAASLMFRGNPHGYTEAGALLDVVLAREPDNFMALAMKAQSCMNDFICGYRAIAPPVAAAARAAAARAAALNDASDYLHFVLSEIALFIDGNVATAVEEARRSLELNPYYAFATLMLGVADILGGDAAQGVAACHKVLDSEPRLPFAGWVMTFLALGYFVLGDDRAALDWAERADRRGGDNPRTLVLIIAAADGIGAGATAAAAVSRLLARAPAFRVADFGGWPFRDAGHAARIATALHRAGLP